MIQAGELVKFKTSEFDSEWKIGLVIKFDKFLRVAEILVDDESHFAPERLVYPYLETQP